MNGTNLNTVTVDGVKYDRAKYEAAQQGQTTRKNDSLGKDAFLQLLVTQLEPRVEHRQLRARRLFEQYDRQEHPVDTCDEDEGCGGQSQDKLGSLCRKRPWRQSFERQADGRRAGCEGQSA